MIHCPSFLRNGFVASFNLTPANAASMNRQMFAAITLAEIRVLIAAILMIASAACRSSTVGKSISASLEKRVETPQSERRHVRKTPRAVDLRRLDFDDRPVGDLVPVIGRDNGLSLF
jgi:hypothetical protein